MITQKQSDVSIFNCNSDSNLFQYRVIAEKLESDLIKFGLTPNQVKVFLYLSKYGEQTATTIFKYLSIPRTETYQILQSLQNKGIVTSKLCHPTIFSALPINDALLILINAEKSRISDLENNESKLVQLWKQIPNFDSIKFEKNDKLQMLQGNNVIFSKLITMYKSVENNIKILCTEKDLLRFYNEGFFEKLNTKNKPKFIIIGNKNNKTTRLDLKNIEIKYIPKNKLYNQCFIITDSSEILFFIRNTEYSKSQTFAFSTTSFPLLQSLELLFDNIWNECDKKGEKIPMCENLPSFTDMKKFQEIMSNFDNIEHQYDSQQFEELEVV